MTRDRGDVVIALDPFKDDASGRPFLIVSDAATPFHGEQYVALSLTTRTWYEDRIPLDADDWIEGGAPRSSSIVPWSVNSIDSKLIERYQGRLREGVGSDATAQLFGYVHHSG